MKKIFGTLLLVLAVSCGSSSNKTAWVFAASSLSDVFVELADSYNFGTKSDTKINLQFGGSSHLVQQVNEGAPAHLLTVANEQVLQNLHEPHATKKTFAHSQLVIAVPKGNPKNITQLQDLENAQLLLGVCAKEVPCGRLAADVFEKTGLALKPDTFEVSARSVLSKLILGELDVGLIYEVDVLAANQETERLLAIPIQELPSADLQNNYVAVLLDAENKNANKNAQDFFDYLTSPQAQEIFTSHGFKLPK